MNTFLSMAKCLEKEKEKRRAASISIEMGATFRRSSYSQYPVYSELVELSGLRKGLVVIALS